MTSPGRHWGALTLANDAVLEWVRALLSSLREHCPGLPVAVIPFDDRQERLAALLAERGHEYFDEPVVSRLHSLGRRFYPNDEFSARGFRKLAAFSGPFERFLFLDSDVVALGPVEDLLEAIERSAADLVHFDTDVEQVYRDGEIYRELTARRPVVGFNAGLFASRRGLLSAEPFEAALADLGEGWRSDLVANAEQPFFNLAVERLGLSCVRASDLVEDSCSTCWSAAGRLEFDGAFHRLRDSGRWDEGWRMRFAHWAGIRLSPEMPNRDVWLRYRDAAP
jgi:hypothetical protein